MDLGKVTVFSGSPQQQSSPTLPTYSCSFSQISTSDYVCHLLIMFLPRFQHAPAQAPAVRSQPRWHDSNFKFQAMPANLPRAGSRELEEPHKIQALGN